MRTVGLQVCLEKRSQRMLRTRMKSETRKSCQNNMTFSRVQVLSAVREFISAVFFFLPFIVLVRECVCVSAVVSLSQ